VIPHDAPAPHAIGAAAAGSKPEKDFTRGLLEWRDRLSVRARSVHPEWSSIGRALSPSWRRAASRTPVSNVCRCTADGSTQGPGHGRLGGARRACAKHTAAWTLRTPIVVMSLPGSGVVELQLITFASTRRWAHRTSQWPRLSSSLLLHRRIAGGSFGGRDPPGALDAGRRRANRPSSGRRLGDACAQAADGCARTARQRRPQHAAEGALSQ